VAYISPKKQFPILHFPGDGRGGSTGKTVVLIEGLAALDVRIEGLSGVLVLGLMVDFGL
jgi:hypothetical protein